MGLHWVEQAALEAQADLAAAAAAERAAAATESGDDGAGMGATHRPVGQEDKMSTWPDDGDSVGCDRRWSHSDELDQLVRGVLLHSRSSSQPSSAGDVSARSVDGVADWLQSQFAAGALCWGRCADYRCVQRRRGRTLLMECARAGATDALMALLSPGPTPDQPQGAGGETVVPSVSVNTASEDGHTALHYASYNGNTAAVHALLVAGANQARRNSKGETPHGSAQAGGHTHVAEVLRAWAAACAPALEDGEVPEYERDDVVQVSGNLAPQLSVVDGDAELRPHAGSSWVSRSNQRGAASWLLIELSGAKGVVSGTAVTLSRQRGGDTVEMVVGRSRSQDLVLRDLEVSTKHAKFGLGACIPFPLHAWSAST